jgi:hypothetical protein
MRVVKDNLTRDLADEIGRESLDKSSSDKQRLDLWNDFLLRVREHFEADQLDESQYELLTKLIQEELPERGSAEVR